jgi:hypothetical protein
VRKSAVQNPYKRQVELPADINDFLLVTVDEFAAQLPVLLCGKFADCPHAATGIRPRVQQCDGGPGAG